MKIILLLLAYSQLTIAQSDWNYLTTEDGIAIYTKEAKDSIMPFKASGLIEANIYDVLKVLKDFSNKNKWSPKLKSVKTHQKINDDHYIFSEYYQTPWPATDREFLLEGQLKKLSANEYLILAHSIDNDFKDNGHIQADVDYLNLKIKKISENQTNIEFEFHGDMKGWMPVWLMNLIQKKWPLRFIQGLRKYLHSI
ncbi:START domain-containing protein [Bacteriovorax sp. Seq25_V]|uniref:START domain-containing protein n=1 Tax=Bacteriovorax sp. Seq25_V TaxID=1201288 RepID=UPI000389EB79|nr:START domain-containing protein [Bacteriovorax sp. Seq25_V]EQC46854.1 START domain protein [Bacteriovorax sp. Seq25_V]